jgi:hypothetical protein
LTNLGLGFFSLARQRLILRKKKHHGRNPVPALQPTHDGGGDNIVAEYDSKSTVATKRADAPAIQTKDRPSGRPLDRMSRAST